MKVIVDTDCGTDDLLALAYLLVQSTVEIEAVTTVHGLTRPGKGAENVLRLLSRFGHHDIPVLIGEENPIGERRRFPASWIANSETLHGVNLPVQARKPSRMGAADYLGQRFRHPEGATVLALGPLTNLAFALQDVTGIPINAPIRIFSMGGAVNVPGNLLVDGVFQSFNDRAEWNYFVDPVAANCVFRSSAAITLVPLDATNSVPIKESLLTKLKRARRPEAAIALEILGAVANWIEEGHYFAWDPLAAVLLTKPSLAELSHMRLSVEAGGLFSGSLVRSDSGSDVDVYLSASTELFEDIFSMAFC